MNRAPVIAFFVLLTIAASMSGLVFVPNWSYQEIKPDVNDEGIAYPQKPQGDVLKGREVYIAEGCLYCHSQQVRPAGFGADIDRGWGTRRSVPRDYMYDNPHLLGTSRTGPDLANIGVRQPSADWHYLHLYDPQLTSKGSIMAPFPFLFERKTLNAGETLPPHAVMLPATYTNGKPEYILATEKAQALVTYLKSLDQSRELPEAK